MKINLVKLNILIASLALISCSSSGTSNNEETSHDESASHNHEEMAAGSNEGVELTVPEGARVFFTNIQDGEILDSPVKLEFGVEGMDVEPAGALNQGMGHHHIIIDGASIPAGTVVPANETNIHYGQGQTEAEIELTQGEHILVLQFADGFHRSYGGQMSSKITVVVN